MESLVDHAGRWRPRRVLGPGDAMLDGWPDGEPPRPSRLAGNTAASLIARAAGVTLVTAVVPDTGGDRLGARDPSPGRATRPANAPALSFVDFRPGPWIGQRRRFAQCARGYFYLLGGGSDTWNTTLL